MVEFQCERCKRTYIIEEFGGSADGKNYCKDCRFMLDRMPRFLFGGTLSDEFVESNTEE